MSRRTIRPAAAARGELWVPGSKSVTNRHLNLALLARRSVVIERPLISEDTRVFLEALRRVGLMVSGDGRTISIGVGRPVEGGDVFCGASGTMLRFLIASLTTIPGRWRIDGVPRLRERPAGELIRALRSLGGRIECLEQEGFAPLQVVGDGLRGGRVEIDAGSSSQYVSGLMMAALSAEAPVVIVARGLVSAPYVEITRRAVREWGGKVDLDGDGALIVTPSELSGGRLVVESDFSSACYLAAGAALLGGCVTLRGLDRQSPQGDRRFFDLLDEIGTIVNWRADGVRIEGGRSLTAVDCQMSDIPDQVPTLAALAPFCRGTTRISSVPHLRLKESDRLAAVAAGLRAVGADVEEHADGLSIPGIWADRSPPSGRAVVDTVGDHRIAMSFAVLGLRRRGVEIHMPGVVNKSYPAFWADFRGCFEAT